VKERRDARTRHEVATEAAQQEFLASLEEARMVASHVLHMRAAFTFDGAPWIEKASALTLEPRKRLGAARARLALTDDSSGIIEVAESCCQRAFDVLSSAPLVFRSHEAFVEGIEKYRTLVFAMTAERALFEGFAASVNAIRRETQTSLLPRRFARVRGARRGASKLHETARLFGEALARGVSKVEGSEPPAYGATR